MAAPDHLPLPPSGAAPDRVFWLEPEAGIRLRAALWQADEALGHVIFLTGRTEYLEKASIPAAEFVRRGFSVLSLDWRGQGLSSRQADPGLKGHVGDFKEFQRDLDALLSSDAAEALTGPRLLVCHSMGGCIGLHALNRPDIAKTVRAAIFCAPMLGIHMSTPMRIAACLTMRIGMALGKDQSWPPFGDVDTPYVLTADATDNVLTQDADVFNWMVETARTHPESAIAVPTLGWFAASDHAIRAARSFDAPDLPMMFMVGRQEEVVDADAVRNHAERTGSRLANIEDGKHELLIEAPKIRRLAWTAIDNFLDGNTLPRRTPA
ncbi:MAG: alpha/beta fold hydrolase [Paracoccaceae bacterium]